MNRRKELFHIITERSEQGDIFFAPILMQFAAHYIGRTYKDFYLDHNVLVDANLTCMRDFGTDAVGLISDPYRESSAYGLVLNYPDESVPQPQNPLIESIEDIFELPDPDVFKADRTRDRIDGTESLRRSVGEKVPVIGWIEGPLAEACALVGVEQMLLKLVCDPGFSNQILQKMMPTAKAFALAQIEAGADIIGVGDAICSQISPKMYSEYIKPLHDDLFRFIQKQDTMVKLHICGNIKHLLSHLAELTPDIIDLDWMVDMEDAYEILGSEIVRCGNIDPVAVIEVQSSENVFATTCGLIRAEQGRPFILSGGCEITPLTPINNLKVMMKAACNFLRSGYKNTSDK
jgi:MtaA/CmuA family methyltransferase